MTGVGWRLTWEPCGSTLAWSLLRVDDEHPDAQAWAGVLADVPLRARAELARPTLPDPWRSPLADPVQEAILARELGSLFLPRPLRAALREEAHRAHTLTLAVRGWPSAIPWDALAIDLDGTRLIERCRVLSSPTPGVVAGLPVPDRTPRHGCLWVIDPGPADGAFPPVYPAGRPTVLMAAVATDDRCVPDLWPLSARDLSTELAARPWQRMLYLGHLDAAEPGSPASAGLVLNERGAPDRLTAHRWLRAPESWPAPQRVALLGCSGDDAASAEQSGLVVAALRAGARLVTTTRWPLPAGGVLTPLSLAVATAHASDTAVDALRGWQLDQLDRWRRTGTPDESPVLWSSLVTYDIDRLTQGAA